MYASFDRAFEKTMGNEGGYSNNPADRGGETYRGISRRSWPKWPGWEKIDKIKQDPGFPEIIKYLQLEQDVKQFYRRLFWDEIHGDMIPSQSVAEKLFDFAVNAGVKTTVKFMQESLNVLNLKGARWEDIDVDGNMGPATMRAVASCVKKYEDVLLTMFSGRMINHYYQIMCNDQSQECFAINWIRRAVKA